MKELLDLVSNRIQTMMDDGTIEKMVEERATAAVKSILDDQFRSYGKVSKALQESIENSLDQSAMKITIEPYTDMINRFAQQQVANYFEGEAKVKLEESLSTILEPLPNEITLTELVKMVAESFRGDYGDDRDEYMSMECEQSDYGWFNLKFWKQKQNKYSHSTRENTPDIELHVDKSGEICWLVDGNKYYGATNYGLEAKLYRMASKRVKITDIRECNEDEFDDTYIGLGEDY